METGWRAFALRLKLGIYSDAGYQTCQERPGSYGYEEIDAKTFAEWGVDYLKLDWCHHKKLKPEPTYARMGKALYNTNRDIVFSICNWGVKDPWEWAPKIAHLWRTTGDISASFDNKKKPAFLNSVLGITDKQAGLFPYAKQGAWNDPDMLEVGNGLTYDEGKAHFTLWCMMAAPLIAGNDLTNMSSETMEILLNKELIAIDQDTTGKQGYKVKDDGNLECWVKPLQKGEYAVCFLNRSGNAVNYNVNWENMVAGTELYMVRDLWKHETLNRSDVELNINIPAHGIQAYRLMRTKNQ